MGLFILNEWIWADLSGDNGKVVLEQAVDFIVAFARSEHQIAFIRDTSFDQKAWAMCKSSLPLTARVAKIFVLQIRQNSDRALILDPEKAPQIPNDLVSKIKTDDHYLVRTMLSIQRATLVTTDAPLREILAQHHLNSIDRNEFLKRYFNIA